MRNPGKIIVISIVLVNSYLAAQDSGQVVVRMHVDPVKKLKQTQMEANAAFDEWTRADENLLKEVLSGPSPETLQKIEKARSLSHDLAKKRIDLFDARTDVYRELLEKSAAPGQASSADGLEQFKGQVKGDLKITDDQLDETRKELSQLGSDPKQQIQRTLLNKLLKDLDQRENMLLKEQHNLETISASDAEIEQRRQNLQQTYKALIADFDAWKTSTKEEDDESDAYYKQLAGMVKQPPLPPPPPPPPGEPTVVERSSFAGRWVWHPGLITVSPQEYVPKNIMIVITDLDGEITGKFSGTYIVPKGSPIKQPVAFEFHGKRSESQIAGGAQMLFPIRSGDGWNGQVTLSKYLKPGETGGGTLDVLWSAEIDPTNPIRFEHAMQRSDKSK